MAELTHGSKAVGLTFNPSSNAEVDEIKKSAAKFIDSFTGEAAEKLAGAKSAAAGEVIAMRKLAQRAAQEASMWAVKAATWVDEEAKPDTDSTNDGGVKAPTPPTNPTDPNGLSAANTDTSTDDTTKTDTQSTASSDTTATPKVAPTDTTAAPAAAGSSAGVANPNAVPQTAAASQAQVAQPATANNAA